MEDETPISPGRSGFPKALTGIRGLDEITFGGLPAGRPTLVCGGAGSGKTLLAMTFLVKGAAEFGEAGVFMSFEERSEELAQNMLSLGYDLPDLTARGKLAMDHVEIERSEIEETGEYDLEGLFVRLDYAIAQVGAKRVVLDTLEALFGGLSDVGILRAELRRLFRWLKDKGVTAIITAERVECAAGGLTRHGLEEYVSDCVILLDHRVVDQISTRRLRVVKYRGTAHGTNEYPFLIDAQGISVMPITSAGLAHGAPMERVATGIPALDAMLGGKGFFVGSSVLLSGGDGTGKTSFTAAFLDAACRRGERCLFFSFEESPAQVIRNMRSIGIDLKPWVEKGLLCFHASRPGLWGLETHLAFMQREIIDFAPASVVVDPVSSLIAIGTKNDINAMLLRLVDLMKVHRVTALMTSLERDPDDAGSREITISSIIDTWIVLNNSRTGDEYRRLLHIRKSRGMAHSNQVHGFRLTDRGVRFEEARP